MSKLNFTNTKCHECSCVSENIENEKMEQLGWYEFQCLRCRERFLVTKMSLEMEEE